MLKLKELIRPSKERAATPSDLSATAHGERLSKLDMPTFDGDILNWVIFWEQFAAFHDHSHLTNAKSSLI